MNTFPQRVPLASQVESFLRDEVRRGRWAGGLPGQRQLCEELHVSRPTLRAALKGLHAEGLVKVSRGRRTTIVDSRAGTVPGVSKTVGLLSSLPFESLSHGTLFLVCALEKHLSDLGYTLEVHAGTRFRGPHPAKALAELVEEVSAACWLLHIPEPEVQNWFSERHIPALVTKARFEGVTLPSLDMDYAAMGRHAAGLFLGLGHGRAAILVARDAQAAARELGTGFESVWRKAARTPGAPPLILHHDGTAAGVRLALARWPHLPDRPTAILVVGAAGALAALCQLRSMNVRIPQDVSVVSTLDDVLFAYHSPTVACYSVDLPAYARRLGRLVVQLAQTGRLPPRAATIMPVFKNGETLGPAPT